MNTKSLFGGAALLGLLAFSRPAQAQIVGSPTPTTTPGATSNTTAGTPVAPGTTVPNPSGAVITTPGSIPGGTTIGNTPATGLPPVGSSTTQPITTDPATTTPRSSSTTPTSRPSTRRSTTTPATTTPARP